MNNSQERRHKYPKRHEKMLNLCDNVGKMHIKTRAYYFTSIRLSEIYSIGK